MISLILLPFKIAWNLITLLLETVGRSIALILGLLFMIVGVLLTITIVGAVIGIPLFLFGAAMVLRGFF